MQARVQTLPSFSAPVAPTVTSTTTLWFKLGVLYLVIGVGLGIAMGASHTFTLRPVHAHMNLLGFTVMTLAGLVYSVYPEAGASRLARIHFWLHNLALPVMVVALTALLLGNEAVVPFLGVAEITAAAGVLLFAANIFINVKPRA